MKATETVKALNPFRFGAWRLEQFAVALAVAALNIGVVHAAGLPIISTNADAKYTMSRYTSLPVTSVDTATPQALIQLAKDHQLFFKAYNDYTDLNRNGVIDAEETTYNHGFDYYGYFDSYKCYQHTSNIQSSGLAGFVPVANSGGDNNSQLPSNDPANLAAKYCSGAWSGNFLNWASMTRIDVVRKILFGGKRVVDDSLSSGNRQLTILEREYLPNDAHSFAKYYNGSDISRLTPFSPPTTDANPQNNGLTICNTTVDTGFSLLSNDVTAAPRLRVSSGNASLWAANERWQCLWREEVVNSVGSNSGSNADNPANYTPGSNTNDPATSGLFAFPNSPQRSARGLGNGIAVGDFAARVQVCAPGQEAGDRCKQYADGTQKPIGLLQEFGDTDRLLFGLVAGTYSKNKGGGDVMKNVSSITNEVNVRGDAANNQPGDGRFILTKGLKDVGGSVVTAAKAADMINGLSLYRIIKYRHNNGTYGTNGNNVNNCGFALDGFADGTCQNWGNPFGEGFLSALRYFGGQPPAGAFRSNDSNEIPGLNPPQAYKYSLGPANACADLSIVSFNNSSISYDGDDLDGNASGISSLGATLDSVGLTDIVGAGEGIHGRTYFVGETGANNNQTCTAKTVDSLGKVQGLCPDAPRVEGTFRIAGLAHFAHTQGIDNKDTGQKHTVKTFGVNLASSTPVLDIPVPGGGGRKVTLLPACQNLDLNPQGRVGSCGLVDFRVVEAHSESGGVGRGKFYVNWEDGEQGGDFDQDLWGTLTYEINSSSIRIITDTFAVSTPYRMGFGFVMNGTTQDGFHAFSGAQGYTYNDPTGVPGCNNCQIGNAAAQHTFQLGSSAAEQLQDPLWYASKWGGFTDSNGNNIPDLQSEWDKVDADGNSNPDGVPDNYFFAVEPRQLEAQLRRVFSEIAGQVASGTSAAVVSNAREGEGALYQALFEATRTDSDAREVSWIGSLHALWVDSDGQLREDGNNNAELDGFGPDPVIELFFDQSVDPARTRVRRYSGDPSDAGTTSTVVEITELRPIWNARDRLSGLTPSQAETQRAYSATANLGRHILTYVDLNQNGVVDPNETQGFVPGNFGNGRFGILNAPNANVAEALVKYVRGNDNPVVPGYTAPPLRSRTLDYDEDGSPETMRLSDIINSSPTLVAQPAEAYDLLYDDDTYRIFRERYRNRRQVVYVGSNGGMIHAFNAGFFDVENRAFRTSAGGATAHPLGSELWAYVPYSLLPHLTWLSDTEYSHVSYMDARPRAFDARVYNTGCNDARNPCGWATLLVVGMRFGGGDIGLPIRPRSNRPLTAGFTGFSGFASNQTMMKTGSAYVVLDITDPEAPPRVLGELRPTDIGFTTSFPTGIAHAERGTTQTNLGSRTANEGWYLTFGNGPNNLDNGINGVANNIIDARSDRSGKMYVVDLKALASGSTSVYRGPNGATQDLSVGTAPTLPSATAHFDLGANAPNSFIGDPVSADWDLDFKANQVYFSSVAGTPNEDGNDPGPLGRLFKFDLSTFDAASSSDVEQRLPSSWLPPKVMIDSGTPGISTPSLTFDEFGRRWVFASTGRLFGDPDKTSVKQQYVFGVIDSRANTSAAPSPMYDFGNLVDVSNAQVATSGAVSGVTGAATESELIELVAGDDLNDGDTLPDRGGWRLNLGLTPLASERSVTSTALLGSILFATAFTPDTDQCGGLGSSRLYGLFFKTGAARAGIPTFGTDQIVVNNLTVDVARRDISAGVGLASSPSLQLGGARDQRGLTIFTQTSTGTIERREGQIDEGARSGELDWRERY